MHSILRIGVAVALTAIVWIPTHDARLNAQAPAQAPAATAAAQETWEQYQGADAEKFLKNAKLKGMKGLGIGVTLPQKAELTLDGVTHFAVFKTIDERKSGITQLGRGGAEMNFQDSWQLEVAAYQVDRTIGLKKVPATIERYLNNNVGSL